MPPFASDPPARLELIGGFRLWQDGVVQPVAPGAQRLIVFLALHPGAHQRQYVSGCLWPEFTQDAANANLRTALWRLGDAAGPLVVEASSSEVALAASVMVDVREGVERSRRVLAGAAVDEDLVALAHAGDLLPTCDELWVLLERERFRQLRLHALERLCHDLSRTGRFGDANRAGHAAVESAPLRETAFEALIGNLLAQGDTPEALRQYRRFHDGAQRELGVAPSSRLRELVALGARD